MRSLRRWLRVLLASAPLALAACGCPSRCDACDEHGNCVQKIQVLKSQGGPDIGSDPPSISSALATWYILTG